MGPNSFRNLTYAAVIAVVGALGYLVYQASKKKQRVNPSVESTTPLSSYTDSTGSIAGTTSSTFPDETTTNTVDGSIVGSKNADETTPSYYSTPSKSPSTEVKEVVAEEPGNLSRSSGVDDGISSSEKKTVTAKGVKSTKSKTTTKSKEKFDAGASSGEYMAVAGSFASKDNAEALVAKLKKLGFTYAEAVKMENSANTYVVAGYYKFKGGADAAVRTLKANKVSAIVKKKAGEIYRSSPAPSKPVSTPKSPAKSAAKPI